MSDYMLSIKRIILISIALILFIAGKSFAMKLFYYDISFSSNKESGFRILPNGIMRIKHKDFILFVRPANRLYVAEGQQLWLWPSRKENPGFVFSEWYYPERSSLISKPNYFYIEILLRSREDGYVLYPMKLVVINGRGERIPAVKYVVVEKLLEEPSDYSYGNLLSLAPLDGNQFSVDQEREEDTFIKLPNGKLIAFAVRFNIPPPSPGDSFAIDIQGLKFMNESIKVPTVYYDTKRTYTEGVQ